MYQDKNVTPVIEERQSELHPLVQSLRAERQRQLNELTASLKQLQKNDVKRTKTRTTKNLIGLLLAHSARSKRANTPKANLLLHCLAPSGNPAITMQFGA